jgi:hypothetical protein
MEVYTSMHSSTAHWDSLLSNGKAIFALGNDDCHDLEKPNHFAYAATLICSANKDSASLISALKQGRTMVVIPIRDYDDNLEKKIKRLWAWDDIALNKFEIQNDSLFLTINKELKNIKIFGQNGKLIADRHIPSKTARLYVGYDWTYLRLELELKSGDRLLLNPVFKIPTSKLTRNTSEVEPVKTALFRGLSLIVILTLVFLGIRKYRSMRFSATFTND